MLNLMLAPLAAEQSGAGLWPYLIGGGALLLLLAAMAALLSFGKGREHSLAPQHRGPAPAATTPDVASV